MVPSHTHRPRLALHTRVSPSPCPFPGLWISVFVQAHGRAGWQDPGGRREPERPSIRRQVQHAITQSLVIYYLTDYV